MMNLKDRLFKRSKPVIREFIPMSEAGAGDVPYLWDAYQKGLLKDLPSDVGMADFAEMSFDLMDLVEEIWILEDIIEGEMTPIGFVICRFDGWQIEPHVVYFDNSTPRTRLRTWVAFIKKTKQSKKAGACLIRVESDARRMANRIEKMGLLQYVGRVWGGRPDGNEYLYSMRCARRH